jgi:hypothetical protein
VVIFYFTSAYSFAKMALGFYVPIFYFRMKGGFITSKCAMQRMRKESLCIPVKSTFSWLGM